MAAPEIVAPPEDVQGLIGTEAIFSVTASGTGPLTYQWYESAGALVDETNANLVLKGIQPANQVYQREYYVVVFDSEGSVTSVAAVLTIVAPPPSPTLAIQSGPQSHAVRPGTNVVDFSVVASSEFPLAYQWFEDGVTLVGETNDTLTLTNIQVVDGGYYRRYHVMVTDETGAAFSEPGLLTILVNPFIVQHPLSQAVIVGENLVLTLELGGTPPFGFRWRKGGTSVALTTEPRLVLPITSESQAGNYSVVVTNRAFFTPGMLSRLVVITVSGDQDINGIPDVWQSRYALDPEQAGRNDDPDHDGFTNYEEYIAATDPMSAESVLKFDRISLDPNTRVVTLGWEAPSNTTYTVQIQTPGIAPRWSRWIDIYSQETNSFQTLNRFNPTDISVFYRLVTPKIK